jgi:hypothetical protein
MNRTEAAWHILASGIEGFKPGETGTLKVSVSYPAEHFSFTDPLEALGKYRELCSDPDRCDQMIQVSQSGRAYTPVDDPVATAAAALIFGDCPFF